MTGGVYRAWPIDAAYHGTIRRAWPIDAALGIGHGGLATTGGVTPPSHDWVYDAYHETVGRIVQRPWRLGSRDSNSRRSRLGA